MMEDVLKLVGEFGKTPLPTILVVGGIFLLVLSVVGRLGAKVVVNPRRQTLAAVLGGSLLAAGTVLYVSEVFEPAPTPPVSPSVPASPHPLPNKEVVLSREFLTSHSWTFLHGQGDVISPRVRLDPSGEILGVGHPNETRWGLEGGVLVFYHKDGRPSTRFTNMQRQDGKIVLSGRLLLTPPDEVVIHVLEEQ